MHVEIFYLLLITVINLYQGQSFDKIHFRLLKAIWPMDLHCFSGHFHDRCSQVIHSLFLSVSDLLHGGQVSSLVRFEAQALAFIQAKL